MDLSVCFEKVYISVFSKKGFMSDDASQNCVFCLIDAGKIPSKKIYEDNKCVAVLQLHPANEGQVLLFPKKHYPIMPHTPQDEITHLSIVSKRISLVLLQTGFCKATTILIQNGGAAGQQVGHFSIHIIPRKKNDLLFKIEGKPADEKELDTLRIKIIKKMSEMLGRPSIEINMKKEPEKQVIIVEPPKEVEQPKTSPPAQIVQEKIIIKEKECDHILTPPKKYSETKEKVAKIGVKKEDGYLYFVDKEGDISRAKMQRRQKKEEEIDEEDKHDESADDVEESYEPKGVDEKNLLDDISRVILGR